MDLNSLRNVHLVGGTALALQLGHRISVDLDLFGSTLPDKEQFLNEIQLDVAPISSRDYFYAFNIQGVKVDILKFPYLLTRPVLVVDGIRMASLEDIAAMKIIAISNRGSKKDFFDLAVLLDHFNLKQILSFYETMCGREMPSYVLQAVCFFEDAELEVDPRMLTKISWEETKKKITSAVQKEYGTK